MKITEIKTYLVNADAGPYGDRARKGRTSRPRGRNWLFVKVYTDDGVTGVGEGGGWPVVVEKAIHELAYFLIGENPFAIERLWHKLYDLLHGHGVTGAVRGGAISAIDMALWDIKGKALGVPVYELLGGKMRDRIPVYGHASTPEAAEDLMARGYGAFKCGPSAETLKTLREAVGYEVEIGVHCHAEFAPSAAIQLGRAIEPYRPLFLEDPVLPENVEAFAKVADKVAVPLATGERFATKWAFSELLARNLLDIVQPETTRLGGITELKKLAAMAEAQAVKVAPHDGSVGPIVEMANVHVLASIPNCIYLEHMANDVPWRLDVAPGAVPEVNGYIAVPDAPGLGVDINEQMIAAHPIRSVDAYTYAHRTPEEATRSFVR
jgi:galactonate dehydratase